MIGVSVSFCIPQIVDGTVALEEVEKIMGSTSCLSAEDWEKVIADYKVFYWRKNADECERVFRQLLADGKVFQTAFETGKYPDISMMNSFWVSSEQDIRYMPDRM